MSSEIPTLVHIGLPKTGSTALQQYWTKSNQVDCFWHELDPIVKQVREMVRLEVDTDLPAFPVLEKKQSSASICQIYSSEALSTYVWGKSATVDQVLKARALFVQALKQNVENAKVLVVVRSPITWIFSLYKQYIQEGGNWTLQRFVHNEQQFIAATLSIRNLYDSWAECFGHENIIILPHEMLSNQPGLFNQLLSAELGIAQIDQLVGQLPKVNTSITDKELELMRLASNWLHKLEKHAERSVLSSRSVRQDLLLILRTELQQKGRVSRLVNRTFKEPTLALNLPENLIQILFEDFFEFLNEYNPTFHGYLEQYYSECGFHN